MQHLPMLTGAVGLAMATAALCLHARLSGRRSFAALVAVAVTLSLFSLFAWAAEIVRALPSLVTWSLICALALIFSLKLYRELQALPSGERR